MMDGMKTYLVTGASSGIGKSITEKLLSEGHTVFGTYNTKQDVARNFAHDNENLTMHQVNLADRQSINVLLEKLSDITFAGIVNSAGVFEEDYFDDFDIELWDKTIGVNLTAPLLLIKGLDSQLQEDASVVNIASIDAYFAGIYSLSYPVSKAGLINLTKSLATALGKRNIRVNSIAPGWINTDMGAGEAGVAQDAIFKTPLGRNGEPQEVAELASFLLSSKSSFITGATIDIDGGYGGVDYVLLKELHNNL